MWKKLTLLPSQTLLFSIVFHIKKNIKIVVVKLVNFYNIDCSYQQPHEKNQRAYHNPTALWWSIYLYIPHKAFNFFFWLKKVTGPHLVWMLLIWPLHWEFFNFVVAAPRFWNEYEYKDSVSIGESRVCISGFKFLEKNLRI